MGQNYQQIHEMSHEVVKAVRQLLLTPSRLFCALVFSAPSLTDEDLGILVALVELQFDSYERKDLLFRKGPNNLSVDLVEVPDVSRVRTPDHSEEESRIVYDEDWTTRQ